MRHPNGRAEPLQAATIAGVACAIIGLILAPAFATPLAAQGARISLEPVAVYYGARHLYDYALDEQLPALLNPPAPPVNHHVRQKLVVKSGVGAGARMSFAPSGPWSLYVEGAHMRSEYERERFEFASNSDGPLPAYRSELASSAATTLNLGAGAGRTLLSSRTGTIVTAEVRVGVERTTVSRIAVVPIVIATSQGYVNPYEEVSTALHARSIGPGLTVQQRLNRWLGLVLRGNYSVLRSDTHEYLVPSGSKNVPLEGPAARWARRADVAIGMSIRLH